MHIGMYPDEIRKLSTDVNRISEEIFSLVKQMDQRLNTDTTEWDGEAKEIFFNDYEVLLPTLQRDFPEVINNLAAKLTYAANCIEESDKDIASKIRSYS